jgi:hypothetical protein
MLAAHRKSRTTELYNRPRFDVHMRKYAAPVYFISLTHSLFRFYEGANKKIKKP